MKPAIFDTHCHLGYDAQDEDEVVTRAIAAGVVRMLDVGIDAATSAGARERARRLPGVGFTAGLHPNHTVDSAAEWPLIEELLAEPDCLAVGETGLDYFRDRAPKQVQQESFTRHLEAAARRSLPVVVHCRDAFQDVFAILAEHRDVRAVLHCFSGGPKELEQAVELDLFVSFAGPVTYPKSDQLRAAAAQAPAHRILVETDAPFLPPQDWRGKRNEPAYIVRTVARLAELRGVTMEQLAAQTFSNALALFLPGQATR